MPGVFINKSHTIADGPKSVVLQLNDPSAEIDIEKFVVSGPEEIKHKIESIERDFNRYEDFQRGWVSAVDLDLVKTNFRNVIFEGFEEDKKEIHQKQSFW